MIEILLVADDPAFRGRLRLFLELSPRLGEEVSFLEAANGNDALVVAEARLPDLVVADVSVTPYGGFGQTLGRPERPTRRRPARSSSSSTASRPLLPWSGADALVNRPVDPFALAQVARQLLEEDDEQDERDEQGEATLEGAAP